VRIHARDSAGNAIATGGAVVWDAFASTDGLSWSPIAGASTQFDPLESAWVVRFPEQSTRWIQVASFFVNSIPTEVTEIQAFELEELAAGETENTKFELWQAQGGLTFRPTSRLTLSLRSLAGGRTEERETVSSLEPSESRDLESTASARLLVRAHGSVELRYYARTSDFEREGTLESQENTQWLALANYDPTPRLSLSLQLLRSEVVDFDGASTTDRASLYSDLRFWDTVIVGLVLAHESTELEGAGLTFEGPSLGVRLQAQVTRALTWTGSLSWQNLESSGPLGATNEELRWDSTLFWRPSEKLGVGYRYGYSEAGGQSRPLSGFQVDWRPFLRGTLTLQGRYDVDYDPTNDRELVRWSVTPRWQLNPRLSLLLEASRQESRVAQDSLVSDRLYVALQTDF
jgi:hypothetical protein